MGKLKIEIDYELCRDPRDCRKCLGICPPGVFNLIFTDEDYHDPQDWKVVPVFTHLCTQCNECVEKCPKKAIVITN
ncbi:MAG: hypothetical protein EU548_04595 [Promethearchaeota archaeon]|nr:MAG: hypothetical protein EU548_04595 [Candidatus Lokiarchaeota archaeon]